MYCNPLCEQTKAGNTKATEILLRLGGDIETECPTHGTPTMVASNFGRLDVLKMLIRRGGRIEHYDRDGRSSTRYRSAILECRLHSRIVDWLVVGRFMEQPRLAETGFGEVGEHQQEIKPWSGPTEAEYALDTPDLQRHWGESSVE